MDFELRNEFEEEEFSPEIKLWRAVLQKAFEDVFYIGMERPLIMHKDNAFRWFVDADDDFESVCYYAQFDPSYVQTVFHNMITKKKIYFTSGQSEYIYWRKNYYDKRFKQEK